MLCAMPDLRCVVPPAASREIRLTSWDSLRVIFKSPNPASCQPLQIIRVSGMSDSPILAPVLVVGAGLSGLVAALTLAKNGIPVRVVERNLEHRKGQRGAGIAPRTLELYHFLEVPEIEKHATLLPLVQTYHPGGVQPLETLPMMGPASDPTPSCPYINYLALGQDIVEGYLREQLAKYSCLVELGAEVLSLEQHAGHVEVRLAKTQGGHRTEKLERYDWVIGADGARGVVRKHLGVTFQGETRQEDDMLVGDFRIKGLDDQHWHMWGTIVAFRATPDLGKNGFVLFANARGIDMKKLAADHDALLEFLYSVIERKDLIIEEVYWVSEFRPNVRMANKFGEGRVFIVGGSVHSPTGGQGGNSSVQDAFNLSWKLALVMKGLSPPSLLETYNEERIPVIAEMLKLTTHLLDKSVEADRATTGKAFERGQEYFMLGVNYRGSRIVVDEFGAQTAGANPYVYLSAGTLQAGDRAPDSPGLEPMFGPREEHTSLFDVFRPWYHTVVIFTNGPSQARSTISALKKYPSTTIRSVLVYPKGSSGVKAVEGADFQLIDGGGHAYEWYGVVAGTTKVVVVRPDAVVGALVGGIDGLQQYFGQVLL
ncbi:FAD/NAD(P)-binding domain-containing protein [Leucogyrophana mollusca]|uniref:FAD/NAD(P)-binding domain-containing protein n=1 Tax=Leucogyrophana mollusca TaxID=85980 RepID=A0ACB8BFW4_9AGAM|nr:FAD/NAD(P)-binding domain-containing protein [Leucogyrophana mollusca]